VFVAVTIVAMYSYSYSGLWLVYTSEPFYTVQLYVTVTIANTSITDGVWGNLLCFCWNWCVCVLFDSVFTFSLQFSASLSVHMTCSVQFPLSCLLIYIYNVPLDRSVT